jgi:nucleoside-diphosphate kinase
MDTGRTFAMIKPDGYGSGNMGNIISMIEKDGFKIVQALLLRFDEKSAGEFYSVHKGTEYYDRLIKFTISDRVFAMELEKENAVESFRNLIGSTDPGKSAPGTIRAKYGSGLPQNAVHGSDSPENAEKEISYIFGKTSVS